MDIYKCPKPKKIMKLFFIFFAPFKRDFYFIMINGNKIKNRVLGVNFFKFFFKYIILIVKIVHKFFHLFLQYQYYKHI
jgi:hypothetical protein